MLLGLVSRHYLINAFRINKAEINCDIHIVVRNDIKNEIAIMNIK